MRQPASEAVPNADTVKPPFRGWWVVFVCATSMFVDSGIGGYAFSALFRPMAESLGTSTTSVIFGLTLSSMTAALSSFVVGPLIDRYGARISLTAGSILLGVSTILLYRIESVTEFYVLFGLGVGLARPLVGQVSPVAAVANWFIRRRAEAFAIMSLGASMAGLVLAPIAGVLIATFGWRYAWVFLGMLPLVVVAPLAVLVLRRRPEDIGQFPDGEPPGSGPIGHADVDPGWRQGEVFKTRAFWLLLLNQVLMTMPGAGMFLHLVSFALDFGFDTTLATLFISVYAGGALSGRAFWSMVTRRLGVRVALIMHSYGWGVGIAVLMAVAIFAPGSMIFFPASALVGAIGGGSIQLRSQAWADYFGRRVIGSITGYTSVANTMVGALAPLMLGAVRDTTGSYLPGMTFFIGCCAVAGSVLVWARRPTPPAPRPAADLL